MYGPPQSCKRKTKNGSWSALMYSAFSGVSDSEPCMHDRYPLADAPGMPTRMYCVPGIYGAVPDLLEWRFRPRPVSLHVGVHHVNYGAVAQAANASRPGTESDQETRDVGAVAAPTPRVLLLLPAPSVARQRRESQAAASVDHGTQRNNRRAKSATNRIKPSEG
jgi:hypothetical protein